MNLRASLLSKMRATAGFTMIELLIVIAILGILAVAVLSAINPVEQINRGRDTGSQSDAEQLIGAIDRHNAIKGFFPWQYGAADTATGVDDGSGGLAVIDGTGPSSHSNGGAGAGSIACHILNKLSTFDAIGTACNEADATEELKISFINRITATTYNFLYIYNAGTPGASTYVCFKPKSKAFRSEAKTRCGDANGTGLPTDLAAVGSTLCAGYVDDTADMYTCLP